MIIVRGQTRKEINPKTIAGKAKKLRQEISKLEDMLHPDWSIFEYEGSAQCEYLLRKFEEEKPEIIKRKETVQKELRDLLAMRF